MPMLTRLATRLFDTPLLLTPEYGAVITTVLSDRIGCQPMVGSEVVASYRRPNNEKVFDRRSGVVTIPVVGGLVHRGDGPDAPSGLQSYTSLQNDLTALMNDNTTRGILIDMDSGGGEAAGIHELAHWMVKMRSEKPIWTVVNTTAGSAAYWLASASNQIIATHGSRAGSIGVYVQHNDLSKVMEKKGIVTSFIYAGKHKVDGNPFEALSDDTRASIQLGVNKLYQEFVETVASNRGLDEADVRNTEAGVFGPEQAYEIGLVDGIGGYGDALASFSEHLNRPFVGYSQTGATMTKMIYDQDALDRARAEGAATASASFEAKLADLTGRYNAAVAHGASLLAAVTVLAPDNAKIAMFAEALTDGASVALSSKLAAKVEVVAPAVAEVKPNPTKADVDAFMRANAANISGGEGDAPDPRAKRLAELAANLAPLKRK
jgi:signal peptide peptidase SppA